MITVDHVDLTDPHVFDEFYAVYAASHDREFDATFGRHEKRIDVLEQGDYFSHVAVMARTDGRVGAVGSLQCPLTDNLDLAYLTIEVEPSQRRRGLGSAVLDELMGLAREAGRSRAFADARWGIDDDPAVAPLFFAAHGFTLDILDAQRDLFLPAELPDVAFDPVYELRSWRGACPDAYLDEYAVMRSLIVQEAPAGEVGYEPEAWDAARIRHEEQGWVRQGRTVQVTVAVAPDGSLAGHTQLVVSSEDPRNAFQWDTLVLGAHRGHGLGLALKVQNQRAAAELLAGRERIITDNAASNRPMIAINEAMGFRHVAHIGEFTRAT